MAFWPNSLRDRTGNFVGVSGNMQGFSTPVVSRKPNEPKLPFLKTFNFWTGRDGLKLAIPASDRAVLGSRYPVSATSMDAFFAKEVKWAKWAKKYDYQGAIEGFLGRKNLAASAQNRPN